MNTHPMPVFCSTVEDPSRDRIQERYIKMKICLATICSIALLLDNSVKVRASVTGPVPLDDDCPRCEECQMCFHGSSGIPGIPGMPGYPGSRGNAGQKGEIGPIGPKSDQGPAGNPGPKGDDGLGLPGAKGPKGAPGLVGTAGQTGAKGQKGEPGETPDDSNKRVAFTVVKLSDFTSSSRETRLPFEGIETLLPGTTFDLDTGTFTCNVPGTYVFMFSVLKYFSSSSIFVFLRKNNNNSSVVAAYSNDSNPIDPEQVSGSAVLVLQGGDTVYLTMAGKAHGDSDHETSFSGFLLFAE
ncbi:complement C1q tumor necrosis factor-related protein 3-like [Patiria miniata]|uniref:C1q domain-containing protein n=1 Tax=Patiria miniata TaxID=46514 RepID=A0A914BMN5_PATMI|nr:complement C1q tumor necrosis factor-related protein 3-like [Patiria miniata]